MKKQTINKYPTKRSDMPKDMGNKIDPTHLQHVRRVGGVSCSGSLMSEKRELPLQHERDYSKDSSR